MAETVAATSAECASLPPGHTPYSWGAEDGAAHGVAAAPLAASATAAERAAIVWLHGVGDTGAGWEGQWHSVCERRAGIELHHPTAPCGSLAARPGEQLSRWFELCTWPVSLAEPEPPAGLDTAIAAIHHLLDRVVASGVPSERLVVGGFSQGGAAALAAGLSYPSALAGICSISGWLVRRADVGGLAHRANQGVPIFFSCGTADPIVSFRLAKASAEALSRLDGRRAEGERTSVLHVDRATHGPKQKEMQAAGDFLLRHLPTV